MSWPFAAMLSETALMWRKDVANYAEMDCESHLEFKDET
jgi:hypothetical protein